MYKALSFDLWNTLIVSNPLFKEERNAQWSNFWQISQDLLAPTLAQLDKDLDKLAEKKGIQTNFQERVISLAECLGLPAPTENEVYLLYQAQERLFLKHLPLLSEPDLPALLSALHVKGVRLFLVSNTGFIAGKTLQLAMEQLGIDVHWEARLFSDEIGFSKPDKRIFEPLTAETGLLPTDILHIGDNFITDYYGARKTGILSCIYTKNLRTFDPKLDTLPSLWELLK
jgi:putative hydrolase of the HAD superfamily